MRVGVTGATGLIGSAVAEALAARGDDVIRFVRPDTTPGSGLVARWDPARHLIDEGDLRRIGGLDAVVHLAGAGIADRRWTPARKREILSSRTDSTALLVETLHSMPGGTPMLACGSAIGYYGSRGDELLDESSEHGADFLAGVCRAWEDATAPLVASGATVARLRTGIVMSTDGGALARQLPLFRLGLGGKLGSGRQWLSPISLRDEVRAILWTIDRRLSGPVNLVAPEPLTNRDFTTVLGRLLHRPTFASVPVSALKIALGAELAVGAVLASQRVIPAALLENGFAFDHPEASSILRNAMRIHV